MNSNSRIQEKIKRTIKQEKNFKRVDNLTILDDTKEYIIEYTRNKAKFVQVLRNLKTSVNTLYTTNILLQGNIDYYPIITIKSDFVIMLLISDIAYLHQCNKKYTILIYEEDPRLSGNF